MKKLMSLKICVMASCLLLSPIMSASVATTIAKDLSKEIVPKSTLLKKVAELQLHKQFATPAGITGLAFMTSLFLFFSREPDFAPNRYDLEEVKSNPTAQNIAKFAYYYLLDGIIGHARKPSSLKVDADGKTIEAKPGVPPRGFYGMLSDLVRPVTQTIGFFVTTGKVVKDGIQGLVAWELIE